MIQDKSNEFRDTWTFLNRRLIEAVQLHDLLSKSEVTSQSAKDTVQSVFVTVRFFCSAHLMFKYSWNSRSLKVSLRFF